MIEENNETIIRQDALGALQKFSLRKTPQDLMIKLNIIDYIISVIKNELNIMSE